MTLPPQQSLGTSSGSDSWQQIPSPSASPAFPPSFHASTPGWHDASANSGGSYGYPSSGTPYGASPGQQSHPSRIPAYQPPSPSQSSGGGAVKWMVIGCLGCSGLLVLGFIALLLIAALGSSEGSTSSRQPSGNVPAVSAGASDGGGDTTNSPLDPADNPAADPTDPSAGATPSGLLGETDDVKVVMTSTERTQRLSDSLWEYETNNEFFVIDIEYTNKSGEAHDIWASDFTLIGVDGNEFSSNTDVSLALEDPLIIEEVNPGLTMTGTLVFEVPPGTEFSELRLEESFGTSTSVAISFT